MVNRTLIHQHLRISPLLPEPFVEIRIAEDEVVGGVADHVVELFHGRRGRVLVARVPNLADGAGYSVGDCRSSENFLDAGVRGYIGADFLRSNSRWKALDEIYKIDIISYRQTLV